MGSITAWKQLLLNAMESNTHLKHSSYMQLATVGTNGKPSNRTVVFRGFQDNTDNILINTDTRTRKYMFVSDGNPRRQILFWLFRGFQDNTDNILFNTDTRTRKIEELKHCPSAEICWYFTDSWEQFRINGHVDIIDGTNPDPLKLQQREKSWFASSVRSRSQYLGPEPGLPRLNEQTQPEISLDPSIGPVDAFCLLILEPDQIDYLNLKSNQRLTFRSSLNAASKKSWIMERVNL